MLGVTGGIAAYKSAEVVRRLREQGAAVRVVRHALGQGELAAVALQTNERAVLGP